MRKLYLLTFLVLGFAFQLKASYDLRVKKVTLYYDKGTTDTIKPDVSIPSGTTIYAVVKLRNEGNTNYYGSIYLYYTTRMKDSSEHNPPKWYRTLNSTSPIPIDTGSVVS